VTSVQGAGGNRHDSIELLAGAVGALWRWRVELVLLVLPVLAWRLLAGPLGELAAAAVVAWALAGLLASPGACDALLRWLRSRSVRRRVRRAWLDAGLAPARLGRLRKVPAGEVARLRVPSVARSRT
jgi:hypothetical protein